MMNRLLSNWILNVLVVIIPCIEGKNDCEDKEKREWIQQEDAMSVVFICHQKIEQSSDTK